MNTQSTFLKLFVGGALFTLILCSARGDEKPEPEKKSLSRHKAPPTYVRNEKDKSKWPGIIRDGIDAARKYFGNYGPVYVYILGHKDKTLNSEEVHRELVEAYCRHHCGDHREKLRRRGG